MRAQSHVPAIVRGWPLLVVAVVAAGYAHTLGYPFHFDDYSNLRDLSALGPPPDLSAIWHFRPSRFVLYLSFAINALVTGRTPAGLRAGNLLIHAGAALLVGALASQLTRALARNEAATRDAGRRATVVGAVAALIFAAHPLATQAVTYLIQRTASLAALLELGAIVLWLRAREGAGRLTWAGSLACALLAAFTKEMSVALPLLIGMLEVMLPAPPRSQPVKRAAAGSPAVASPRRDVGARVLRVAPYFVVWIALLATMSLPTAHRIAGVAGFRETSDIPRLTYFLTELTVLPRYLRLFLWPGGQSLDPAVPLHAHPDTVVILGALILAVVSVMAFMVRPRQPLVTLGWLWFLIAILPESSLFPIRDVMVEHRMYLPLAGLAIAAADALVIAFPRRPAAWLAPAAITVALIIATFARNQVWRSEMSLWSDVIAKAPGNTRGYDNRGLAYEAEGNTPQAEADYRHAIALDSTDVYSLSNLGKLYGEQGRLREGLPVLLQAVRVDPNFAPARTNLGLTWMALGDTAKALQAWKK
jgi:hypothetical protein